MSRPTLAQGCFSQREPSVHVKAPTQNWVMGNGMNMCVCQESTAAESRVEIRYPAHGASGSSARATENDLVICVCLESTVAGSRVEIRHPDDDVLESSPSEQIPLWRQEVDRLHQCALSEKAGVKGAPSSSISLESADISTVASATELPEAVLLEAPAEVVEAPTDGAPTEVVEAPMEVVEAQDPVQRKHSTKPNSKPSAKISSDHDAASLPEIIDPDFDLSTLTDEEKKQRLKAFVDATRALGGVLYELQSGVLTVTAHYVSKSAKRPDFFDDACYQFKLTPGTGLPGRAFNDPRRAKIIPNVSETTSVNFPRKDIATEANIQSLCCVRYGTGVVEVSFKKKVEQPPTAMKPKRR